MKRLLISMALLFAGAAASAETQDPVEHNRLGVEAAKQGQYTDSLTHFNKSIAQYDKESAKSIHNLGWLYESKGDSENALIYYEEALRRNPDQVHTLERAGYLRYRNFSFETAIMYGEKVMKLDPVNQEVIKWLPDAYAQMFKLKGHEISKNAAQADTLRDKSSLSDITNVKGSETFKQNSDGSLTWDAKGSDIYYQGTAADMTSLTRRSYSTSTSGVKRRATDAMVSGICGTCDTITVWKVVAISR